MSEQYAHNDHYKWLLKKDGKLSSGRDISELGKTVANLLGFVGRGLYNCPIKHNSVEWDDDRYIKVVWSRSMSNWDFLGLSLLWVECHRRMLRVTISGVAPGRISLEFWQRKTREGGTAERLPDCEEMIAMVDKSFGRCQAL